MQSSFFISSAQQSFFETNGYLIIDQIIDEMELANYRRIYDEFLNGTIDTGKNRSDLGAREINEDRGTESITQIMWPSDFLPELLQMSYHSRALALARTILGDDIEMDFDMLINKAPFTNTETPWHQDAAYWIKMPDKRALSCWLALDDATKSNGCMWYVPGSHLKELRLHRFAGKEGGALMCDASEAEAVCVELKPGSCVIHHGNTLHYSRGNNTAVNRRAFITNFRPASMISLERAQGFDHGRSGNAAERNIRNEDFKK